MLARVQLETAKAIAASTAANTKQADLLPCRKYALLVVPNATHTFGVKVNQLADVLTGAAQLQEVVITSGSQGKVLSAIIEAKTDLVSFEITNGDAGGAHTYDVYVNRIE